MAHYAVSLSVQFQVKTESLSVEFPSLIVAVFERIPVKYTQRIFSLSAAQFTVEKSNSVECFTMIDKNCFCEYNFNLCTRSHIGKTVLETLTGELNALT